MQYGRRLYKICINLLLFLKYNHLILLLLTFRCCNLVKENDFEIVRKILHYLFYQKTKQRLLRNYSSQSLQIPVVKMITIIKMTRGIN